MHKNFPNLNIADGMYNKNLTKYYDMVYSWKDYKRESDKIVRIIKRYKRSEGNELLEVACGTGSHLVFLKKKFSCTGLDYSQGMLNEAKRKVKGVRFVRDNMIDFMLNKKYDVITSLFSGIGYVKTYKNLEKTINNFSYHLKNGGVVVIEPWLTHKNFNPGVGRMIAYEKDGVKIVRLNTSAIKNGRSILDMHYLVADKGMPVRHWREKHEMGLFDVDKTLKIMRRAGLDSRFLKNGLMKGRGLYIGVKR